MHSLTLNLEGGRSFTRVTRTGRRGRFRKVVKRNDCITRGGGQGRGKNVGKCIQNLLRSLLNGTLLYSRKHTSTSAQERAKAPIPIGIRYVALQSTKSHPSLQTPADPACIYEWFGRVRLTNEEWIIIIIMPRAPSFDLATRCMNMCVTQGHWIRGMEFNGRLILDHKRNYEYSLVIRFHSRVLLPSVQHVHTPSESRK